MHYVGKDLHNAGQSLLMKTRKFCFSTVRTIGNRCHWIYGRIPEVSQGTENVSDFSDIDYSLSTGFSACNSGEILIAFLLIEVAIHLWKHHMLGRPLSLQDNLVTVFTFFSIMLFTLLTSTFSFWKGIVRN